MRFSLIPKDQAGSFGVPASVRPHIITITYLTHIASIIFALFKLYIRINIIYENSIFLLLTILSGYGVLKIGRVT